MTSAAREPRPALGLPGPSRRIRVEPIRTPEPARRPQMPAPEREPQPSRRPRRREREPVTP